MPWYIETFLENQSEIVTLTAIFNQVFFYLPRRKQSVKWIYDTKFIKRTAKITELIEAPLYPFNENDFLLLWITNQAIEVTDKDQSTSCQNLYSVV